MGSVIARCPKCVPPTIRRADGRRIVGWMPEQLFVGYLVLPRRLGVPRPPATCPNCQATLIERTNAAS